MISQIAGKQTGKNDGCGKTRSSDTNRVQGGHKGAAAHKLTGPKHITKLQKEMQLQMMKLVAEEIDVAEIYSPPRVTKRAEQWGLKGGWSLDLTTKDSDGKA